MLPALFKASKITIIENFLISFLFYVLGDLPSLYPTLSTLFTE